MCIRDRRRPTQWHNADWTLTSCTRMVPRPPEIPVREFPGISGNMSLEKLPREFPGILLRFAFNFLYTIISSFDKCSYSARHNVKVRSLQFCWFDWNFDKSLSRDFSAHKIRFGRVYQHFHFTNPVSPARRRMILHRTQQSTLIIIIQKFIGLTRR